MSPLAKEIATYTVTVAVALDQAKTSRDELRFNSVLSLLTQAQVVLAGDEEALARRLYSTARNLAKLKQRAEEK